MTRSLLDAALSGVSWEENPLRRLLSIETLFQCNLTPDQLIEHLGRVYTSLAKYAHPDKPGVTKEQAEIFRDLNSARHLLKDPAVFEEAFKELRDAARRDALIEKRYQNEFVQAHSIETEWREKNAKLNSQLRDKDREVKDERAKRKNEKIGLLLAPTFNLIRKSPTLYKVGDATRMAILSFYASCDNGGIGRDPQDLIQEALNSSEDFPKINFSIKKPSQRRQKADREASFPLDHGLSRDYRKALDALGRTLQSNFGKVSELKAKLAFPLLKGRIIYKEDRRLAMLGCVLFEKVGKTPLYSEAAKQKGTLELEESVVADECLPFLYETGLLVCCASLHINLRKREVSKQLQTISSEMSLPRDRCQGCDIILRVA